MRYRITLEEQVHNYEAVIFRELAETEIKSPTITHRKLDSISQAYTTVLDEMRNQSAFKIIRIAESPENESVTQVRISEENTP